jgi:hypothetical protein
MPKMSIDEESTMNASLSATVSERLNFDLSTVPMDVFDLADSGLTLESLTTGHGMQENAASSCCSCPCSSSSCSL